MEEGNEGGIARLRSIISDTPEADLREAFQHAGGDVEQAIAALVEPEELSKL